MEYQQTYAEMSNEELLNVAADVASLEGDARIAIAGELSRRRLSERDVIQYRQDVTAFKPEHFWGTGQTYSTISKRMLDGYLWKTRFRG